MPYFAPISQVIAEIWPFFNFSSWRPSAILDLQKFEILNASKVQGEKRAPPCHISRQSVKPLRRYGQFSIF